MQTDLLVLIDTFIHAAKMEENYTYWQLLDTDTGQNTRELLTVRLCRSVSYFFLQIVNELLAAVNSVMRSDAWRSSSSTIFLVFSRTSNCVFNSCNSPVNTVFFLSSSVHSSRFDRLSNNNQQFPCLNIVCVSSNDSQRFSHHDNRHSGWRWQPVRCAVPESNVS